jgi:polyhydroxyalkanoate synthesis repressor PhaR
MSKVRIIKKYPNRRLYDTAISCYVTIEDVHQLVVSGTAFEVHDAKTGVDLTRQVLLQIITEREESGQPMLSTQLLQQLIRFYGDQLQGFMSSYLEKSMQSFLDQQGQFRNQLNNLIGQSPLGVFQAVAERNLDLLKTFQSTLLSGIARPNDAPSAGAEREESAPKSAPKSAPTSAPTSARARKPGTKRSSS